MDHKKEKNKLKSVIMPSKIIIIYNYSYIKGLIGRDCKETNDCVNLFSSKVNKSEEIIKNFTNKN